MEHESVHYLVHKISFNPIDSTQWPTNWSPPDVLRTNFTIAICDTVQPFISSHWFYEYQMKSKNVNSFTLYSILLLLPLT
jgi:hypothetical protein